MTREERFQRALEWKINKLLVAQERRFDVWLEAIRDSTREADKADLRGLYTDLAAGQKRLDPDFDKALADNVEELYEA